MGPKSLRSNEETNVRSLDRLKSLNDIQDVNEQLLVASSLCNHAHRSDMILRWLLTKISDQSDYRILPATWQLFTTCIRLIQPVLLTARLKAAGILNLITKALLEADEFQRKEIVMCTNDLIQTLLGISKTTSNQVEQVVSVNSSIAASFLATWVQSLWTMHETVRSELPAYLNTGLQIWDLRRAAAEDDECFVDKCWYPTSLLLTVISPGTQQSTKRNVDGTLLSNASQAQRLERLIAQHVFHKSRASFLKHRKEQSGMNDLPPDHMLTEQVAKLSAAFTPTSKPFVQQVFSTQLNIAIRCGSINTQRQMLQEISWNDIVFQTLLNQVAGLSDQANIRRTALSMLDVVKARSTLSLQALQQIAESHGGLSDDINWPIVVKIVALNARVFCDVKYHTPLFDAISAISPATDQEWSEMAKHGIILPIVDAYAQDRRLADFMKIWEQQLNRDKKIKSQTIWLDLDDALEGRLEQYLTPQQITTIAEAHLTMVLTYLSSAMSDGNLGAKSERRSFQHFKSTCVVTSAIMRAIKSTDIQDSIEKTATGFYDHLSKLGSESNVVAVDGLWSLALHLFNICMPRWSLTKADSELGLSILKSKLVAFAMKETCRKGNTRYSVQTTLFVGRICEVYGQVSGLRSLVQEKLHRLLSEARQGGLIMLVRYPSLFPIIPAKDLNMVWQQLKHVSRDSQERPSLAGLLEGLQEATKCASPAVELSLLQHYTYKEDEKKSVPIEANTLVSLLRSSNIRLDKHQYTEMAKLVIPSSSTTNDDSAHTTTIEQLALLQQVLDNNGRSHTIRLSLEDTWQFCARLAQYQLTLTELNEPLLERSSAVVERITDLALHQYCARTDSHDMEELLTLIRRIASAVERQPSKRVDCSTLIYLSVFNLVLGSAWLHAQPSDEVQSVCNDMCASVVLGLDVWQQYEHQDDQEQLKRSLMLSALLETGLALLKKTELMKLDQSYPTKLQKLSTLILTRTTPSLEEGSSLQGTTPSIKAHPAILAYEIMCYDDNKDVILLAHAACRLLTVPFSPKERVIVIKACSYSLTQSSSIIKVAAVRSLLPLESTTLLASTLAIARTTFERILKAELSPEDLTVLTATTLHVIELVRKDTPATDNVAALRWLNDMLRHHAYVANQYLIEETLNTIRQVAAPSKAEVLIFPELCNIVTGLLKHHRARLNGRFHILLPVLQALLERLLAPSSRTDRTVVALSQRHAHALSRVLTLFCDPPQMRHRNKHAEDGNLIDQSRRTRALVGSFVPSLLHSYCMFVLKAPPREGIREALTPGLWAIMSAMEISNIDSMKILSSAMTNNERSVLRSVVEEWRASGRWSGK